MTEDTVQPALERPRFRNDLVAQPLEEEGVRYVDVTDPSSGSTFRFYDVEYSIACAMDGERDIDNLQEWTRAELGIEASSDELQSVVNTLAELGYLENVEAQAAAAYAPEGEAGVAGDTPVEGPPDAVPQAVDNVPTEVVDGPPAGAEEAAEPPPSGYTDETAREVTEADEPVMEIDAGEPGEALDAEPPPEAEIDREAVPHAVPHPAGPIMDEAGTGNADDELPETHVDEVAPAGETAQAAPPPPPQPGKPSEAEMSFAGLLEDEERAAAAEPVTPIARSAGKSPPPQHLDDEDPTQVPTTGVDDDDDDVSVDLSAHIALDKREVQEAVRSSRVHAVPSLPPEYTVDEDAATPRHVPEASQSTPPVDAPAGRSGPPPIPPAAAQERILDELRSEPRTGTKPPEDVRVPPAVALPTRPQAPLMDRGGQGASAAQTSSSASQSGARPRPARPIEPTRMPPPAKAPPKSSSSLGLIIMLFLAAAAFAAAYIFRDRIFGSDDYSGRTPSAPRPTGDPPAVPNPAPAATAPAAAAPEAQKEKKDDLPAATVRGGEAGGSGPVTAKSASGGNVAWVADDGAAVEEGAPVVKLFGFAKVEAKVAENVDRGKFYQGKLDEAKTKGDTAAAEAAQRKVDEKKKAVEDANKELAKYVVAAPAAGTVKLSVQKGSQVKPGDTVAEIGGAKSSGVLRATFDAGENAANYKDGGNAIVAAKGAPDKQFAAVVEKVEGTKVHVKLVAAGAGTAAAGDEVVLLPPSR